MQHLSNLVKLPFTNPTVNGTCIGLVFSCTSFNPTDFKAIRLFDIIKLNILVASAIASDRYPYSSSKTVDCNKTFAAGFRIAQRAAALALTVGLLQNNWSN